MTGAEFDRLIKLGVLIDLNGGPSRPWTRRHPDDLPAAVITLRPDLPNLPVTEKELT